MCDESGEAQKMEHVVIAHGSVDASGRGRKADELCQRITIFTIG